MDRNKDAASCLAFINALDDLKDDEELRLKNKIKRLINSSEE